MLGLSDVTRTSRVRSLTARELPLAVEGYLFSAVPVIFNEFIIPHNKRECFFYPDFFALAEIHLFGFTFLISSITTPCQGLLMHWYLLSCQNLQKIQNPGTILLVLGSQLKVTTLGIDSIFDSRVGTSTYPSCPYLCTSHV